MAQVPEATSVAVDPETVQMAGVVDVKLTCRPELARAVNVIETEVFANWFGIGPNAIVWAARLTVKLSVTAGAAA
jgi:hypothetical protein